MRKRVQIVKCPTRSLNLIAFDIDPVGEDVDLVRAVMDEVQKHGAATYDPSTRPRDRARLTATRYLGVLSEKLITEHLQSELGQNVNVSNETFESYENHVDIEIQADQKIINLEVRSSYLYAPLPAIVCRLHDVIGPYSTSYKSGESPKDFYLRALINQRVENFSFQRKHALFFVAGASYQLFLEKGWRDNLKQQNADYFLVPLIDAPDAGQIVDEIRRVIGGV